MNLKKIKPMFNGILTTANKYTEPQYMPGTNIIDPSKSKTGLKEYQTVVEVGNMVKEVNPGDIICINPQDYAVKKYQSNGIKEGIEKMNPVTHYNFNIVILDGEEYLLLKDRDIDFLVVEYDDSKK